jgi:type I restriction enzyme S subunit
MEIFSGLLQTITAEGLNSCGATMVQSGSVVVSTRAPIGSLGIAGIDLCTNQGCKALVPIHQISSRFTAYFLGIATEALNVRGRGATFLEISGDELGAFKATLPPCQEQVQIATFLDRETTKIDSLIAEQQRLIELLQEKRQAVISHAVTKGLNPDVPMKDSGVEWLGEVPEHWGVTRLKHVTDLIVDCPHETPTYTEDGEFLVIRTADLDRGTLLNHSHMRRVDDFEYTNRIRRAPLERCDIVYGREGERWGHAALVPLSAKFCLGQRMMQFRCGPRWAPAFLMWLLNSRSVYLQGSLDTVGATSPHVNVGTIRNYALPDPPLDEQALIADSVATQAAQYDSLIHQCQQSSCLLSERRSALISAAVTGQIDVRGLVPEAVAA